MRGKRHPFNVPPRNAMNSAPLEVLYRAELTIATGENGLLVINPWAAAFSEGLAFPSATGTVSAPNSASGAGVGNAYEGVLYYAGSSNTPGASGTAQLGACGGMGQLVSTGGAGGDMGVGHLRFIGGDITIGNTSTDLNQGGVIYAMLPGHRRAFFSYFNGTCSGMSLATLSDASNSNRLMLKKSQSIAIIPTPEQTEYKTFHNYVGTLDQQDATGPTYVWRDPEQEFFASGFSETSYGYSTAFLIAPASAATAKITIDLRLHYEAYHIVSGQPTPMTMTRTVDAPNASLRDAMLTVVSKVNNAVSRGATPTPRTWAAMAAAAQNPSVTQVVQKHESSFMHRLGDGFLNAVGAVGSTALRVGERMLTGPPRMNYSQRNALSQGLLTNGGPIIEEL